MSWTQVKRWRDALWGQDPVPHMPHLSPEGAREAWSAALASLHDAALDDAAAIDRDAWQSAAVVCAGTVSTAAIEWAALLLGRGGSVVIKHPQGQPDVAPLLAREARRVGLPLAVTARRSHISRAQLVVAMGRDETVERIRSSCPESSVLALGHRVSVAWVSRKGPVSWTLLAADAALHDGRGCMSPGLVLSPLPLQRSVPRLARAMEQAERRWPRGDLSPAEQASIRARVSLARVVGLACTGPGWAVIGLPLGSARLQALPRALTVVQVRNLGHARRLVSRWSSVLSTVGTDDPGAEAVWRMTGASRVCPLGQMQRPPLSRVHDGYDLLRVTSRRATSQAPR